MGFDPKSNYYLMPNQIFQLGLRPAEFAVYSYLRRCTDRKTYKCWPSFTTIGGATNLSKNTVKKCVEVLEEKCLISTEHTLVRWHNGRLRNGNLMYTVLPISTAVNVLYEKQFAALDAATERQKIAKQCSKF